jgi:predicted PurR-regulated permease PerM
VFSVPNRNPRLGQIIMLIALVLITAMFFAMIRVFLITILMAAIFSGLAHPLFRGLARRFGGHEGLAAGTIVLGFLIVVVVPMLGILGLVATQALRVSDSVRPWLEEQLATPGRFDAILRSLPFAEQIEPYRSQILMKGAEIAGAAGNLLFNKITSTTRNTIAFLFHFFLYLYTMFYFLKDGPDMLTRVRTFLPIADEDQDRMFDKFLSVTRATLKGTFLIGLAQGTLAGMAFAVVGIEGALFWGTIMSLLSVVPGLGTAVVWVPASIVLLIMGDVGRALGLALFCGLVVGTIDNILRPRLVGKDTRMHPLLILFSTMGGLAFFGFSGVIVGPILTALFITIWEMFGAEFRDSIDRARGLVRESDA